MRCYILPDFLSMASEFITKVTKTFVTQVLVGAPELLLSVFHVASPRRVDGMNPIQKNLTIVLLNVQCIRYVVAMPSPLSKRSRCSYESDSGLTGNLSVVATETQT